MMRPALWLFAVLPLAACQSESGTESDPDVQATNASVEEVAEQVREASEGEQFIRPGRWVSTVRFEEFSAPGIPEDAAEGMNRALGDAQSFENCLTEEETQRPNERFFAGADNQCRYENFTMGGGKIDATMRCTSAGGAAQVMRMQGSYSPDSYQLSTTSTVDGPGGQMTMRMRIEAKRAGECKPAEQ